MNKKCKVILLPTDKEHQQQGLYFVTSESTTKEVLGYMHYGHNPSHLYICPNIEEKIEKENWIIPSGKWYIDDTDTVRQSVSDDLEYWKPRRHYNEIIATTNKSLRLREYNKLLSCCRSKEECRCYLPQIPESFIHQFIESYNKGVVIVDVEVEYEELQEMSEEAKWFTQLKLNKSNEISILPIKESWSRDEVKEVLYNYISYLEITQDKRIPIDDWLRNQNL
jgi:hypothetical protein